jgi:hypothetical protein
VRVLDGQPSGVHLPDFLAPGSVRKGEHKVHPRQAARYPSGRAVVISVMFRSFAAIALLVLSACQMPGSAQGCRNVQIDWVDFIQLGTTQYVAGPGPPMTIQPSELGPVVAHVNFKVAGNVCDPNYKPRDGDAAFLEPGTPIYQVNGQPASKVVAARRDGQIITYAAKAP